MFLWRCFYIDCTADVSMFHQNFLREATLISVPIKYISQGALDVKYIDCRNTYSSVSYKLKSRSYNFWNRFEKKVMSNPSPETCTDVKV